VERSQESEAEDDILYEGKAKLFIKKTGPEWRDMGLGTLTLRKVRVHPPLPSPFSFDNPL
jgi:hypothetical protein